MLPAVIAGLVREQRPDCATHTQEFLKVNENGTVDVRCSCTVGLTLVLPKTPPPLSTGAFFENTVAAPGPDDVVLKKSPKPEKGKVGDGA